MCQLEKKEKWVANFGLKLWTIGEAVYFYIKSGYKDVLRKHYGKSLIFTGKQYLGLFCIGGRQLEQEKLLPGEDSASILKIGCYTVRISRISHRPCNVLPDAPLYSYASFIGLRITVISARHNSDPGGIFGDGFKEICRIAGSVAMGFTNDVKFICTAKPNLWASHKQTRLFVLTKYTGSSFSVDTWYSLNPYGEIEEAVVSPFD